MNKSKLEDMIGGWFIGNFEPSLLKTNNLEVAVKNYKSGDAEDEHYHKVATEYTVILKGKVRMMGIEYNEGEILTIYPNESTDFLALTDVTTVVVKVPGAPDDKYITNK
jgi:quercetin dioxygenase-like cupin family protein